jgi:hypothetical protein
MSQYNIHIRFNYYDQRFLSENMFASTDARFQPQGRNRQCTGRYASFDKFASLGV